MMRDRSHIVWLYNQLPRLVSDGTLTPDIASKLRYRFGEVDEGRGARLAIILFGILGATLIGGGTILLIAHNWDTLGRHTRVILSFLPLLIGQRLSLWALFQQPDSTAWREGAGAFLTMAIGSSIALVAQTYNIGGDFGDFMLTWVMLTLPVAYLMNATFPAILYLFGILIWSRSTLFSYSIDDAEWKSVGYWLLLALILPWWVRQFYQNKYQARSAVFGWVLAITLPVGLWSSLRNAFWLENLWQIWLPSLASFLFLAGSRWWDEARSAWQRPLQITGGLGIVALALILSFEGVWDVSPYTPGHKRFLLELGATLWIGFAWLLAALVLFVDSIFRRDPARTLLGALPLFTGIAYLISQEGFSRAAMAIMNLYLFVVSVAILVVGLRNQKIGLVNAGMLTLSALILCRFFDADIGFVVRGIAFIMVGIGFLTLNVLLLRNRGAFEK